MISPMTAAMIASQMGRSSDAPPPPESINETALCISIAVTALMLIIMAVLTERSR